MTDNSTQHETKDSKDGTRLAGDRKPEYEMEYYEKEYKDTLWNHPYFIYIVLTLILFLFLGLIGWIAWDNDWIPHR